MKEQLISFNTAKLAKEKGFNYSTSCGYDENGEIYRPHYWEPGCETNMIVLTEDALGIDCDAICLAPTQSLLQKWLREEHNLSVLPEIGTQEYTYYIHGRPQKENMEDMKRRLCCNGSYEDSLERGLQEALKLIKN